jgi:IS1 family transposase
VVIDDWNRNLAQLDRERRERVLDDGGLSGHELRAAPYRRGCRLSTPHEFGLWVAIDADTKIVPCVMLGGRSGADAHEFITDLASRLRHRVQLTSDGHRPYLEAVEAAFGADIDYAMLVKLYGQDQANERRYSPAQCIGAVPTVFTGRPDPEHISTSFVERQNWTVRTTMRRYTRLSNGFSRKVENHMAAVAINYFAYNFIKIHHTLRVSPAMAAGVTKRLFDVSDLVALLVEKEAKKPRS